ncbi:unnamed protein product [Didymodactylos carnosus]|uniref:Uncharacterized protein n=1 Tax=Didymodactylos carnosus TaxID=1234261 RepID=A0A815KA52_9BILA|nr:unnamed protein product [Didymodactylos carnosus]CAF1513117.1 unnamed protein product [Didymodactylos carnosus]CAF4283148.1 unnamed protein product [Didymodactylos carnosus]CAF4300749.1 unnamed protein product [Didymodactylos carnosus]
MFCGLRAPRHVYSCTIKNNTPTELKVQVEYRGVADKHTEKLDVQIASGEEQKVNEKVFQHDDGSSSGRKTVHRIKVRKFDGKELELKEPFDNVTSPQQKWIFEINEDEIKSVGPSSP